MNWSRFSAPLNPREHYPCAGCDKEFHYLNLDDEGNCPECRITLRNNLAARLSRSRNCSSAQPSDAPSNPEPSIPRDGPATHSRG